MKNLFQNKKILLISLILMASCLGILGVAEKGEAASCSSIISETYSKSSCSGGAEATSCQILLPCNWDKSNVGKCEIKNITGVKYCINNFWPRDLEVVLKRGVSICIDNNSGKCTDGYKKWKWTGLKSINETVNNGSGFQINAFLWDNNGNCTSNDDEPAKWSLSDVTYTYQKCCPDGYTYDNGKCKAVSTDCESVDTQECVNISECVPPFSVIPPSKPNDCPDGLVCVKKGSCKTETTTCDDSDGGEKENIFGVCKENNIEKGRDKCFTNKNSVEEWFCDSSNECDWTEIDCDSDEKCAGGKCVPKTTTPNPCYWQDVGCGPTGGCKDTEMHQKCVPSGCSGGLCSAGKTRCDSGHGCSGGGGDNNGGHYEEKPPPGGAVQFTNPLSTNSFEALVMGIINWILGIVVSLAILFLIIGGLMYIVSAGDEEKIKKAKNIILYSVIGLGVVILSWSIITELKDILGVK